jgi:hypothetical protein
MQIKRTNSIEGAKQNLYQMNSHRAYLNATDDNKVAEPNIHSTNTAEASDAHKGEDVIYNKSPGNRKLDSNSSQFATAETSWRSGAKGDLGQASAMKNGKDKVNGPDKQLTVKCTVDNNEPNEDVGAVFGREIESYYTNYLPPMVEDEGSCSTTDSRLHHDLGTSKQQKGSRTNIRDEYTGKPLQTAQDTDLLANLEAASSSNDLQGSMMNEETEVKNDLLSRFNIDSALRIIMAKLESNKQQTEVMHDILSRISDLEAQINLLRENNHTNNATKALAEGVQKHYGKMPQPSSTEEESIFNSNARDTSSSESPIDESGFFTPDISQVEEDYELPHSVVNSPTPSRLQNLRFDNNERGKSSKNVSSKKQTNLQNFFKPINSTDAAEMSSARQSEVNGVEPSQSCYSSGPSSRPEYDQDKSGDHNHRLDMYIPQIPGEYPMENESDSEDEPPLQRAPFIRGRTAPPAFQDSSPAKTRKTGLATVDESLSLDDKSTSDNYNNVDVDLPINQQNSPHRRPTKNLEQDQYQTPERRPSALTSRSLPKLPSQVSNIATATTRKRKVTRHSQLFENSFKMNSQDKNVTEIFNKMKRLLRTSAENKNKDDGWIYCFRDNACPGWVKVGSTGQADIDQRKREAKNKCKRNIKVIHSVYIPHAYRVEHLIHTELMQWKAEGCTCVCSTDHKKEWFRIEDDDHIIEVMNRWENFINKRPYRTNKGDWMLKPHVEYCIIKLKEQLSLEVVDRSKLNHLWQESFVDKLDEHQLAQEDI